MNRYEFLRELEKRQIPPAHYLRAYGLLVANFRELRTADNCHLLTTDDVLEFLRSVIENEAPRRCSQRPTLRIEQQRYQEAPTCPECKHEHVDTKNPATGRIECGAYLGEGEFCHCEAQVTA